MEHCKQLIAKDRKTMIHGCTKLNTFYNVAKYKCKQLIAKDMLNHNLQIQQIAELMKYNSS